MNSTRFSTICLLALLTTACRSNKNNTTTAKTDTAIQGNPFLEASKLPFQAPAFDKIKNSDYQPAMEEGMKQQQAEIAKIADNPAPPTFENTMVAIEKSGVLLNRVNGVFSLVSSANTNPGLQKIQETEAPKLAANQDAIYLNPKLFNRVETLYKNAIP